jgi:hypothetical protein
MVKTCICGKVRYAKQATAKWVARQRRPEVRLWVYRCPLCLGWHMTSQRPHGKRASVRRPPRDGRRA